MKTLTFKEGCWHYRLANFGHTRVWRDTDICSYTRSVIVGGLLALLAYTVVCGIAGMYIFSMLNWLGWALFDYQLEKITLFITFITLLLGCFVGVVAGWSKASEVISDNADKVTPNFVRVAYRSWKDKFCARVEFK